ncbi:hypothetical protein [Paraburkholderia sp. BL17N1]|uniref:hypothetical protein n=1 Tax=Paraburkholderia sp. BL17N1 TaxID=1938798 RepID=UPI000EAD5F93|nr:hypothetical protein [Paraburkholderia sp. BL17N1]RKR46265.1 hypothetical protein B0G82_3947 [Paraburkholderia sp. BL17N1]
MSIEIEKYLGTVMESTAKTIASRVGLDQLDVSRELNRMVKDGVLEREMKKGEYAYWLTRKDSAPSVQQSDTDARPKSLIEAVVTAANAATPKAAKPEADDMRELRVSDLLVVLGVSPDSQFKLIDAIDNAKALVTARDEATVERDAARAEVEAQKTVIAKLKENVAALEQSIDDLTGVADVQLPKVYVTVGRYAKPKRHADLPRAQRRAASLVRNEKESEVLVLAPVGRMVRGSEWRSQ